MRFGWFGSSALKGAALAALVSGCASEKAPATESVGTVEQPIQNGALDATHKFAVGVCNGSPGRCRSICSGALILPNVVATARHCVSESDDRIDCNVDPEFGPDKLGFYITTNDTMLEGNGGAGWYKVKSVARPADKHVCGNDIAFLVLEKSLPSTEVTPIIPGIQHLMWDPAFYVPSITAVGYGRTSPATDPPTPGGAGLRRIKEDIPVRCIPGSNDRPCGASVNPKEFVAGDGTCQGDSGSSAYDAKLFATSAPVSFGVLSRGGQSADGTTCVGSLYTRFDAHRDFVLAVVKEASANWTLYPEPSWTAFAEPPVSKPPVSKDAGADAAIETGDVALGSECTAGKDCTSGVCVRLSTGTKVCSQKCDDAERSCSSGYACSGGYCLEVPPVEEPVTPAATPAPTPVTSTTSGGCTSTAGGAGGAGGESLGGSALGLGLALVAGRRARRRPLA